MGLELQLVDQLEETIKDFERNLADMYASFLEQIRAQYPFEFLENDFIGLCCKWNTLYRSCTNHIVPLNRKRCSQSSIHGQIS